LRVGGSLAVGVDGGEVLLVDHEEIATLLGGQGIEGVLGGGILGERCCWGERGLQQKQGGGGESESGEQALDCHGFTLLEQLVRSVAQSSGRWP
jgi:hypothetical protein